MRVHVSALLGLTVLLTACGQPTTPTPSAVIGAVSLPISTDALSAQTLTIQKGKVTVTSLGTATVQVTPGFDYLHAQFAVKNGGDSQFDNLTLVALAKPGNVGGTAIESIATFGGVASADQAAQAVKTVPLHRVNVLVDGSLSLVDGASDFQAFTPGELADLTANPSWNTTYSVGDKPLNYGFVASKCSGQVCKRALKPGETGVVNVTLRIPKGSATGSSYNFVMDFAVVNDPVSRVTRSVMPVETAEAASARLTALGVATGGEVMTVGPAVSSATTGRTDVSTPGLKVVRAPFVTTLAGGTPGYADGTGTAARFYGLYNVVVDATGNVIVSDRDNNRIRMVTPDGVVTTVAGGAAGYVDATGTEAKFNGPTGLALDPSGNLIITDQKNHRVRKMTPSGVVTTLAGAGTAGYLDAGGINAQFNLPSGVAVDQKGNIYISDDGNHRVRKIDTDMYVSTLAGSGTGAFLDATGTAAQFWNPAGIALDSAGNLYVADHRNHRVRKITPAADVSTLAGSGTRGFADGTGPEAQFAFLTNLAVDSSGNVYVGDRSNHSIRMVTAAGEVSTLAGTGNYGYLDGDATVAMFRDPQGVTVEPGGNIIVADASNGKIRKIYMP